jgi:hypothetical protein
MEEYTMKTKHIIFIAIIAAAIIACGGGKNGSSGLQSREPASYAEKDLEWAVYWYLCGSDLESGGGAASIDLDEMLSVELPDNAAVIIQTGGAAAWNNEDIDPSVIGRYVYDSDGFALVEKAPNANMGTSEALADFLGFCEEYFPAQKKMVLFWDHGGGTTTGVAFDENYDNDYLSLEELRDAFAGVYELSEQSPPLEVIGFDACLMATLDVAHISRDIARYLVASEELESALGWDYAGWLSALAENPGMDGEELGRAICDTYQAACEAEELAGDITLSVIDLGKSEALLAAYDRLGYEALYQAAQDNKFFIAYNRVIKGIETYGPNSRSEGYTDMADLGHLLRKSGNMFPPEQVQETLAALEDCVVYSVKGPYRKEATGLSMYHPFDMNKDNLSVFKNLGTSKAFGYFYEYNVNGAYTADMYDYLAGGPPDGAGRGTPDDLADDYAEATITTLDDLNLQNLPVTIEEYEGENYFTLNLGPEAAEYLTALHLSLDYCDPDSDDYWELGYDNDLNADWENGVFRDNFNGEWPALDGHIMYIELYYEGDAEEAYDLYHSPIKLNGREYTLQFIYDYNDNAFKILGARKGIETDTGGSRNMRRLRPGDTIQLLTWKYTNEDEEFHLVEWGTPFSCRKETAIDWRRLDNGEYDFMFKLIDTQENYVFSDVATFTVEDGNISMDTW